MDPKIRYSSRAREVMQQLRELSEDDFHSLMGLIILLSTDPLPDSGEDELEYFGSEIWMPVYEDEDWKIAYRPEDGGEALRIIAVRKVS